MTGLDPVMGPQPKATSSPVTLATDDPALVALGTPLDTAYISGVSAATTISVLKALLVSLGVVGDAAVGDASGSANAHLRMIARSVAATLGFSVNAGATDAATLRVITASDGPLNSVLGTAADAAAGDATGTINAHLRQVAKLLGSALAVTMADGAAATLGTTTDAKWDLVASGSTLLAAVKAVAFAAGATTDAAAGDANATINAHVRQVAKLLAAALTVNVAPSASAGGLSIYRNLNLIATGQLISAGVHKLHVCALFNNASSVRYVKFYDKATAPTVGTDTPALTIPVAASSPGGLTTVSGLAFTLGIGIGATTGIADSDVAAPATNDVIANIGWI